MPDQWTALGILVGIGIGGYLYVTCGLRFRRWAVEGRAGIPRFSANIETIMLWLVYSVGVSLAIVVVLQTLRDL